MITKEGFQILTPKQRGYVVYMCGARDDEPNVPDEENPYPKNSTEHREWNEGAAIACHQAADNP